MLYPGQPKVPHLLSKQDGQMEISIPTPPGQQRWPNGNFHSLSSRATKMAEWKFPTPPPGHPRWLNGKFYPTPWPNMSIPNLPEWENKISGNFHSTPRISYPSSHYAYLRNLIIDNLQCPLVKHVVECIEGL